MVEQNYIPRLRSVYDGEVRAMLLEKFQYKNLMQVPRVDKIVLNMGVGETTQDTKKINSAFDAMQAIAGQRPVITRARNSIAGFKVREEMPIGVKVTLRRTRMYEFIDRLINIALPRVRDFRGLNSKSFDGHGNYALGIKEHLVFPEINYDNIDVIWGMDIIICTTTRDDAQAYELLRGFNFPFRD